MTFSDPVQTLNRTSDELRNWDMRKREGLQDLMLKAADELDDMQRGNQDEDANSAMMIDASIEMANLRQEVQERIEASHTLRVTLGDLAGKLEEALKVRIGQMDSDSVAAEKLSASQEKVREVAQVLRGAAES